MMLPVPVPVNYHVSIVAWAWGVEKFLAHGNAFPYLKLCSTFLMYLNSMSFFVCPFFARFPVFSAKVFA